MSCTWNETTQRRESSGGRGQIEFHCIHLSSGKVSVDWLVQLSLSLIAVTQFNFHFDTPTIHISFYKWYVVDDNPLPHSLYESLHLLHIYTVTTLAAIKCRSGTATHICTLTQSHCTCPSTRATTTWALDWGKRRHVRQKDRSER